MSPYWSTSRVCPISLGPPSPRPSTARSSIRPWTGGHIGFRRGNLPIHFSLTFFYILLSTKKTEHSFGEMGMCLTKVRWLPTELPRAFCLGILDFLAATTSPPSFYLSPLSSLLYSRQGYICSLFIGPLRRLISSLFGYVYSEKEKKREPDTVVIIF